MNEALHAIFDHYGPILDIVAKRSVQRKGQAFIVFDSQKSALQAIEEMSGFELYGKQMKVSLAKTHSDETLKRKATEEQFEQHKRERLTLKGMFHSVTQILAMDGTKLEHREETRRAGQQGADCPSCCQRQAASRQDRSCRRTRRVRPTKQDSFLAEYPGRCHPRGLVGDFRAFRRLQGSSIYQDQGGWLRRV